MLGLVLKPNFLILTIVQFSRETSNGHGLETMAVTKKQLEEMEVAEMKRLRFAVGVMRKD